MVQENDGLRAPGLWEVTGNHDLAFPCVSRRDGGIHRVNVLHRGALGLVEWSSAGGAGSGSAEEPLLAPELREDGRPIRLGELAWERLHHWIPRLRATPEPGIEVRGTLCAPGGGTLPPAGAVYLIELKNGTDRVREFELGLAGTWRWSLRTVATSRPLGAPNRAWRIEDGTGLVLEAGGEPGLAALAATVGGEGAYAEAAGDGPAGGESPTLSPAGSVGGGIVQSENGTPIRLRVGRRVRVAPGRRAAVAIHFAAALERDGARARARALERIGAAEVVRGARLQLARMTRQVHDAKLAALLNRNLIFCVFFSVGRAIDDERLYSVVSRSPLCRPAAVFRESDALLWSVPALRIADAALAREVLLRAFEQFSHRPGGWSHSLDGGLLDPGFALDHFCAYGVALDRYIRETGDETILDESIIGQVLRELDDLLLDRMHPELALASTELLPSGVAAGHPYVLYDNVLVRTLCDVLERRMGTTLEDGRRANFAGAGEAFDAEIWRRFTAEVDGLRVFAGSTDLDEAAIFDDPTGSLGLLPHLGFCDADDPVWTNTLELLHAEAYPLWHGAGRFPGMGAREHEGAASLAGLCTDLLGPRRGDALETLRALPFDGGVACGWYDPRTGETVAEPHHASLAGFLAWSLWHALDQGGGERGEDAGGRRAGGRAR